MNPRIWLLLLCVSGCVKTSTVEQRPEIAGVPAKDFYPLAVDNTWGYQIALLGEKAELEVKILKEDNGVFEDSSRRKLPDGTWSPWQPGNQLFTDAFGVRDQKRYLLRDPVEVGTEWSNVVSVSSVERYKIIAANVGCDCPAGHFEGCVVVESTNKVAEGKALVNELTFAPKVGLVRVSTLLVSDGKQLPQSTLELSKFQVKGAAAAKAP